MGTAGRPYGLGERLCGQELGAETFAEGGGRSPAQREPSQLC